MKNALRKLCSYHTVFVTALPLLLQAMLKAPAMILGVKGPSNQHCRGGGGGMRESAVFLRKCPKTFGQDCMWKSITHAQSNIVLLHAKGTATTTNNLLAMGVYM